MPFIDTARMKAEEKRPGWTGRIFSSPSMTFAYWDFKAGADIHLHDHEQEEVWHVIEGQLEVTVDGETAIAGPGMAAIVPSGGAHKVVALTDGRAIVVDYPLRDAF